jgi:hypothetical protein
MRNNNHLIWKIVAALPFFVSLFFCFLLTGCYKTIPELTPKLVVIDCNTGVIHTDGTSIEKFTAPQFNLPQMQHKITEAKQ